LRATFQAPTCLRPGSSVPLSRELQPFTVSESEPVSDYVKHRFRAYCEVRVGVLGFLQDLFRERAELANRFRTSKILQPGTSVVLCGPRRRKAVGQAALR
jgi:hypothetical protein